MTSMSTLLNDLSDNGTENEKYIVVGFDGDDDPWDPKNFSKWKKCGILFAVTHGAAIVTCTSSLYVSSPRRVYGDISLCVTLKSKTNFMFQSLWQSSG
jgi:hypothetical protein